MASTFKTWFRRSRTTFSNKHFEAICNNINHSTFSAKNHKKWLKQLETLNCVNYSMLNPKHSAEYVCRTETYASSTARAITSYEMVRQRTRSTSSQFLTSFRFTTTTSGKVDHTVINTGRKKRITSASLRISSKRKARKEISWAFTIVSSVMQDSERPCSKWGRTEEVTWTNWRLVATGGYVRIFVGSDTMPVRHQADFKKALFTLRRLKNQEDQAYHQSGGKALVRLGGTGKILGSIPHRRHHRDDGPSTDRSGKPPNTEEYKRKRYDKKRQ